MTDLILVGGADEQVFLQPAFATRHGLVAGATGTGKTVTAQILAEGFSRQGVPVFLADVKGDLAGLSQPIAPHPKIDERVTAIGIEGFAPAAQPVVFWDVFGDQGAPVRTTISDAGPLLLSHLLELNAVQEGVLNIAFRLADDEGLLLLDLKDLRSLLQHVGERRKELSLQYGNVSTASIGAIQRRLLVLEEQGAEAFFGEPALDIRDLMRTDLSGRGVVNILDATRLFHAPQLYATVLLWLLAELFEELPERGDVDKPDVVFFFDEAHLLFDDAPKALLEKIEQVVRLIRSKGVGVFFITQNPLDLPDSVAAQLGNRIQHGLRAFTPKEQKVVRAVAQTFRDNQALDEEEVLLQLGVGEALVSTLADKGIPGIVQRTLIRPPTSRIGTITPEERAEILKRSPVATTYNKTLDRESAYEKLAQRAKVAAEEAEKAPEDKPRKSRRQGYFETTAKSALRTIGREIGRSILRSVMGTLKKGR